MELGETIIPLHDLVLLTEFIFNKKGHYINLEFYSMNLNKDMLCSLNKPSSWKDASSIHEYDSLINHILSLQINKEYVFKAEPSYIPKAIRKVRNLEKKAKLLENFRKEVRDLNISLNISKKKVRNFLKQYFLKNEKYYEKSITYFFRNPSFNHHVYNLKFTHIKEAKYFPVLLIGNFKGLITFNSISICFDWYLPCKNICTNNNMWEIHCCVNALKFRRNRVLTVRYQ